MRSGGRQTANCVQARACPGCVRRLSRRRILFGNRVPSRRHTDDLDFSFENRHQYGSTARSGNRSAREGLENLRRNRLLRLSREILARQISARGYPPQSIRYENRTIRGAGYPHGSCRRESHRGDVRAGRHRRRHEGRLLVTTVKPAQPPEPESTKTTAYVYDLKSARRWPQENCNRRPPT